MALDELRKRIFQKNEDFTSRQIPPELQKHENKDIQTSWARERHEEGVEEGMKKTTRKIIWWGLGIGLGLLAVGIVALVWFAGGFSVGRDTIRGIDLRVEGGEEIASGKKVAWKVIYKNNNSVELQDAVLRFEFPPNAQPLVGEFSKTGILREQRDLGNLAPGEEGEDTFFAILFGAENEELEGKVFLEYRPEGSSARFSREGTFLSRVISTVLGIELDMPNELKSGQEVEMKLTITSNAETPFRGLWFGLDYPEAFEFVSSNPQPERGNTVWSIGDLKAGGEFNATIRGIVKDATSAQNVKVTVGLYDRVQNTFAAFNTLSESFVVTDALLGIAFEKIQGLVAENTTVAGSELEVMLEWQNNLPVSVENVIVEVAIEGNGIDLRTLESRDGGEYDARRGSLKWVPGRVSDLLLVEPGVGGVFSFAFDLSPTILPASGDPVLRFKANISSPDLPPEYEGIDISGSAQKELKIASHVSFSQQGYYFDSRLVNSGPLPPKVGEETTYLIVWSVLNTTNDINDTVVRATLPSYVRWVGNIVPTSDTSITFNPQTRELVWSPGVVSAGTGYVNPAREIAFQIGLTPSLPQVDDSPELISKARLQARDSFTNYEFSHESQEITTLIRDDLAASGKGRVQE